METATCRRRTASLSASYTHSFEETLNAFDKADRILAGFLIITISWEQVVYGFSSFPKCCFRRALTFLSDFEQGRIAGLLADYIKTANVDTIKTLENLPKNFKQRAWSQLKTHEQHRIQSLLDAHEGDHRE
ncbi:MAG: hypothetical protein F6K11_30100 [Leptolyngbya sp. SIO3F4]|nr:hypothetical protein [Leptolyngbya sp. SIO3F4]